MKDKQFVVRTQDYHIICDKFIYHDGEVVCYNGTARHNEGEPDWLDFLELHLDLKNKSYWLVDYVNL